VRRSRRHPPARPPRRARTDPEPTPDDEEGAERPPSAVGGAGGRRRRDLFEILHLAADPEALHAVVLAWLLDPRAEHGLGDRVLRRVDAAARAGGLPGLRPGPAVTVELRRHAGRHLVELRVRGRPHLLVAPRLPGAAPGEPPGSTPALAVALGEEPVSGAGAALSRADLVDALEGPLPGGPYGLLVAQYRDRLRRAPRAEAIGGVGTSATATPPRTPTLAPEGSSPAVSESFVAGALRALSPDASSAAADDPSLTAEVFPSDDLRRAYIVGDLIGRGAQGLVFEVAIQGDQRFAGFERPVERAVVKVARRPEDEEALLREHAVGVVPDPGLARVLDAGTVNDGTYLVLERLQAQPGARLGGGPVPPAAAVDIFVHLLGVLRRLHFRRRPPLVLCDIKPDNVMLRMAGVDGEVDADEYARRLAAGAYEPVFVDLGCALERRVLEEAGGRLRGFVGTPLYLPPEAIPLGERDAAGHYSLKTDVYALTLTFYELLTGRRPFAHRGLFELDGEDLLYELLAYKRDRADPVDRRRLGEVLGSAAADVAEVLDAGLAPEPAARANVQSLLNLCRRHFRLAPRHRAGPETASRYDAGRGLPTRQARFPRAGPA